MMTFTVHFNCNIKHPVALTAGDLLHADSYFSTLFGLVMRIGEEIKATGG